MSIKLRLNTKVIRVAGKSSDRCIAVEIKTTLYLQLIKTQRKKFSLKMMAATNLCRQDHLQTQNSTTW